MNLFYTDEDRKMLWDAIKDYAGSLICGSVKDVRITEPAVDKEIEALISRVQSRTVLSFMDSSLQSKLWVAIYDYVKACGGDVNNQVKEHEAVVVAIQATIVKAKAQEAEEIIASVLT